MAGYEPNVHVEHDHEKCEYCQVNPAEEYHTCPFQEDVNDDYESLCNCCVQCEHECADAI